MIDDAKEAEILRLFHAEQWPLNTVADELGLQARIGDQLLKDADHLCRLRVG